MSSISSQDQLNNSIEILSGYPFPSSQFSLEGGMSLIRIRDLDRGKTETTFVGPYDPDYLVQDGDILIGMDGDFVVVRWRGSDALLNQRVCKVTAVSNDINQKFLFWWLQPHVEVIHRRTPQTTVRHLSVGDIRAISKPSIDSAYQERAANLLDKVDSATAKTLAVIAKLKQIRAGLLHDLLTRGLDHDGELRDPVRHPEQFKDSPLGRISKEWQILTLRECLLDSPQNGIYKPARQIGFGTLLIGQTSIGGDRGIDLSMARRAEIDHEEASRFSLQEGDILVSRVYATLVGVGQPAIVPALPEPAVYESNMMRLQVDPDRVLPRLFFEVLRHHNVRARVIAAAHLSNQASINQFGLNPIPVVLPHRGEQEKIVSQVLVHEQTLRTLEAELDKLSKFKSGLMSDLLTGHVRVPENINIETGGVP